MLNAICGCEDTGLLFIHLIYLYFFPEGETLVSIHSVLIAGYYRALRASLELARGEHRPQERYSLLLGSVFVACVFVKTYQGRHEGKFRCLL